MIDVEISVPPAIVRVSVVVFAPVDPLSEAIVCHKFCDVLADPTLTQFVPVYIFKS